MNDIQIDRISFSTAMLLSGTIAIISLLGLKTHCLTIDLENKRALFFAKGFGSWKSVHRDQWNYNVYFPDIQSIEIVSLSKEERRKNLGSKYLFHKYLKIKVSKNGYKYIYISLFTKKQINNIINIFSKSVKSEHKY